MSKHGANQVRADKRAMGDMNGRVTLGIHERMRRKVS